MHGWIDTGGVSGGETLNVWCWDDRDRSVASSNACEMKRFRLDVHK